MVERLKNIVSKKYSKLFLLALLVVVMLYGWHCLFRLPFLPLNSWEAVPRRAAVILDIPIPQHWLTQLQEERYNNIRTLPPVHYLQQDLEQLKVLFEADTSILNSPLLAVLQHGSTDKLSWLYISRSSFSIEDWLAQQSYRTARQTVYRDVTIYTLNGVDGKTFAISRFRNLLLVGEQTLLIETAIDELKETRQSLRKDAGLRKLRRKAEAVELYVHVEQVPLFLAPYTNTAQRSVLDKLTAFASWMQINSQSDSTGWQLKRHFSPIQARFWKALEMQEEATQKAIQQVLPNNLAIATVFSLSEVQLRQTAGTPWMDRYFLPWLEGQLAVGIVESPANSLDAQQFVIAKATDRRVAEQRLQAFAEEVGELNTEAYQTFELRRIMAHQPLAALLSADVAALHNPWYVLLDEYVIFCNSKNTLENWIDRYLVGETLVNDVAVQTTYKNADSKVVLYSQLQRLLPIWQQLFKPSYAAELDKQIRNLNQVQQLTLQFGEMEWTARASGFATNTNQVSIIERIPLQAEAATPPQLIQRPDGQFDVFIQDKQHQLYCFDRHGDLRWNLSLDEPLLSEIQTIDFYRNGQLQYVFNTASRIYGLDKNGTSIGVFPLELQSPATNGVTVVDFTHSRTYSYFVACANGNMYGYDQTGQPLDGWKPKAAVGEVRQPMLHFQRESHDYLVAINSAHQLYVFQRDGQERFAAKTLESPLVSKVAFQATGNYPRIVAAQQNGKVLVSALTGESFNLPAATKQGILQDFIFADAWGDERKDYITLSGNQLSVAAYEKTEFATRWAFNFSSAPTAIFKVHSTTSKSQIGALLAEKQQIFLFDETGTIRPGFPLAGTTPFQIAEFFGGGEKILVVGNGAELYYYRLIN